MGVGSTSPSRANVASMVSGKSKLAKSAPLAFPLAVGASDVVCDIKLISSARLFAGQHRFIERRFMLGLCA